MFYWNLLTVTFISIYFFSVLIKSIVLPVVSSGQWGGQAFETYRRTKTVDLLYMAGGGIMAHPMGAAAGVAALQQAWKAAVDGLSIEEAANQYPEFKKSVEKFG